MTVHPRRAAVFTAYERCRGVLLAALVAAALLPGAAPASRYVSQEVTTLVYAGGTVTADADWFDFDEGTNPRISEAVFSTTEYYSKHEISNGRLEVQVKTAAELSALSPPPPRRFEVNVTVTLTNDEGLTGKGKINFQTVYERTASTPAPPSEAPAPTFAYTGKVRAHPNSLVNVQAAFPWFDNTGTNPSITGAVFSTTEYYRYHGISRGILWVEVMSAAELNAMASPPLSPFTVDVTVTMTNDEGQTAEGTLAFETTYDRVEPEPEEEAEAPEPTFSLTENWNLFSGGGTSIYASQLFDNAGTNARVTGVEFSTLAYFGNGYVAHGQLWVAVKSAAELNAMALPPPSRFTVDATVTMENDEGQTASGTMTFQVSYKRASTGTPAQPGETEGPTFSVTEPVWAPPGKSVEVSASRIFDNAGRSVRFTDAVFSTTDYYSVHEFDHGQLKVQAKTAAELNALASPPPSTFEVTVEVTMTNNQGQTASGTLTYQTTYKRVEPATTPAPPAGPPPTSGGAGGGTN